MKQILNSQRGKHTGRFQVHVENCGRIKTAIQGFDVSSWNSPPHYVAMYLDLKSGHYGKEVLHL